MMKQPDTKTQVEQKNDLLSEKEQKELIQWVRAFEDIADEATCTSWCKNPFKQPIKESLRALDDILKDPKSKAEKRAAQCQFLGPKVHAIAEKETTPWPLRQAAYRLLYKTLDPEKLDAYRAELEAARLQTNKQQQRRWALTSTLFSGMMVLINGLISVTVSEKRQVTLAALGTTFATTCFGGLMTYYTMYLTEHDADIRPKKSKELNTKVGLQLQIRGDHNIQDNKKMEDIHIGSHNQNVNVMQTVGSFTQTVG